jgi:peroxiredoxin
MKIKTLLITFVLIVFSTGINYAGEKAPGFTLPDLNGTDISLSDYEGKVLLLNFWATWCPPCRVEIPYFNDFYKKYYSKGFEVLGISLDRDGAPTVLKFKKSNKIAYPVVIGDNSTTGDYQQFIPTDQRNAIPFTFIIDRDGNVVKTYVGSRPKDTFEADILEVLGK